jgi:hypothetical protein
MNLLYFRESFSEYFCSKKQDRNIQHKYEIHTIGDLTYSCKSVENLCWLQLIHIEHNNHSSNEPKTVLAFANYSAKLCNKSDRRGNNIFPLFGKMFSLN